MISLSCLHTLNIQERTKCQHFTTKVKLGGKMLSNSLKIKIYEISKPAFCL